MVKKYQEAVLISSYNRVTENISETVNTRSSLSLFITECIFFFFFFKH